MQRKSECYGTRLENKELPYNAFAHREDRALGQGLQDRCTLFRASARVIDLSREAPDLVTATSVPVACVELIGSRFLRRMVRNIVVRTTSFLILNGI